MTLSKIAAVAVLTGIVVALAMPAEAAKKRKHSYIYYGHEDRQVIRSRSGVRITVRPRSYLNPGTETKQYDAHDADYAFPPGYSTFADQTNRNFSYNRMPFNGPFDVPGPKY